MSKDYERLQKSFIELRDENTQNSFQILELKAENQKLREVLEFYANEMNYSVDDYYGISGQMRTRCILYTDLEERNDVYRFAGKRARQILKELNK